MLSLEEYARLPNDDLIHELDEGELISMTFPKRQHTVAQQRLYGALYEYLMRKPVGEVGSDAGFLLEEEPPTLRGPDVFYLRAGRAEKIAPDQWMLGAPDLAIEVISPSETAAQIAKKARQYLNSGAVEVWVVYPETSEVLVYDSRVGAHLLRLRDTLQCEELLPGFGLPLSELFA